jgi:hypothetical protein
MKESLGSNQMSRCMKTGKGEGKFGQQEAEQRKERKKERKDKR